MTPRSKGGGVGPDMFYYLPTKEYDSNWAHTTSTAALPKEMLRLAASDQQKKAYADGWISHYASDLRGHHDYVNVKATNPHSPEEVELGVDANLADVTGLAFYVPYGLVQDAYKNTYGSAPSKLTIYSAALSQQAVFYIEKAAIDKGAFDNLKNTFNDFWSVYYASIADSEYAIKNPSTLTNRNLNTGEPLNPIISSNAIANSFSTNHHDKIKIDPDIISTKDELLKGKVIEIPMKDDKANKVLYVGEPIVKDQKAFDDAIAKLVKRKTGK